MLNSKRKGVGIRVDLDSGNEKRIVKSIKHIITGGIKMLKKRNQKGFTLIEIIAVLVILGILAAIAIPKFLDLQDSANTKALQAALAEGLSTVSMQYARITLSKGSSATTAEVVGAANANKPGSGDFSYIFALGSDVKVTVNWIPPKTGINAQSKMWEMP